MLLLAGPTADMPPWMIAVASMVVGHYFGTREGVERADAYAVVVDELRGRIANGGDHP